MPNLNVGLALALGIAVDANAVTTICNESVCDADDDGYFSINSVGGCMFTSASCWGDSRVLSCMTCMSGYTLTEKTVTIPCSGGIARYNTCVEDCTGCSNCTSDTSWSSAGTGYEKKVTRTCNCNTCRSSTSYRCAAGFYGSSTNGTSGCSECSPHNSIAGISSAGSTAQTSCYISSSSSWSFSDTTGSGSAKFASNCYYSN